MKTLIHPWRFIQILKTTVLITAVLCLITDKWCYGANPRKTHKGEGYALAAPDGRIILSKNSKTMFVPASTLKVLTGLAAIHYLGEQYRFKTVFFMDTQSNLKIKGYGDPLLISEEIQKMAVTVAEQLKKKGIATLKSIIIDNTFFDSKIIIPGAGHSDNPYDASIGALCANFNTISFKYDKKNNRYISNESQTPLLPFLNNHIAGSGKKEGRITLARNESETYAGELLKYFLTKNDIKITDKIRLGTIQTKDRHLLTYSSSVDLQTIVRQMLKYSSNFIANQLALTIGATVFSSPATVEKGSRTLINYAKQVIGIKAVILEEGSGLSRQNQISPAAMIKILQAFKPYHSLMVQDKNELYKTGTLRGIRTRCGYFSAAGGLYPFAVMVNKPGKSYDSIIMQMKKTLNQYENHRQTTK